VASPALPGPALNDEAGPNYTIAALGRALDLLEAMARIGPASLAELAVEASCTRTAGFRLLRTLQARGFAIQDKARGAWRLGARWDTVGRAAATQGALAAAAMPHLEALGRTTGETVYLRVRDGLESETIAEFRPAEMLPRFSHVGERRPLHAGPGRLLLAHAPAAVQARVLAQRLPRFTPATPTDPRWIAGDLPRMRARPCFTSFGEIHAGAVTVAAPVRDASGGVVAVLSIAAASLRMRPSRAKTMAAPVIEAAAALSLCLGHRPPDQSGSRAYDAQPSRPCAQASRIASASRPYSR
jgi:DNA-binding IclR family transcriptional regulator